MKTFIVLCILLPSQFALAQWEPDVRLTNDPGSSKTSDLASMHAIASSGDSVNIVWSDDRDGNFEIYYKRSLDGGLTWGADIRLTNSVTGSVRPSIAISGLVVHVAWIEYPEMPDLGEVFYKRSIDGGNTWEDEIRMTYTPFYTLGPCLAVSASVVHLVYYDCNDDNFWDVYYKRSTDNGLTWEPEVMLTYNPAGSYTYWPSICANGPVLHVVWHSYNEIYYKRSEDNGITWGPTTQLTDNEFEDGYSCIGVSGSDVHVVWEGIRDGNSEICYKRSTDGGINWEADTRLTYNSGDSFNNNVAVSGSGVFVVWSDHSDGNWEIYFKSSTNKGLNWQPEVRLTNNSAESNNPFISRSENDLHVIWQDTRDGNYEIYYKKDPTGGALTADFMANPTALCQGEIVQFTDLTSCHPTQWQWTFPGGIPYISYQKNPQVVYETMGNYDVTLHAYNGFENDQLTKTGYITVFPQTLSVPGTPSGPDELCGNPPNSMYTTSGSSGASEYSWQIIPDDAGIALGGDTTTILVNWTDNFTGDAQIKVKALNMCTESAFSPPLTVTLLVRPIAYALTGSGTICEGLSGLEIGQEDSDIGVQYELFIDSITTGSIIAGTGSAIAFGIFNQPGTYWVMATDLFTTCENQMANTVEINVIPLPVAFQVFGGGPYCFGTSGCTIGLSSSQINHTYELYLDNQQTGITLQGNGSMITFPNITAPGTYTVMATENSALCTNMMEGTVEVYVIDVPEIPPLPQGPEYVDLYYTAESEYTTVGSAESVVYEWSLEPTDAGNISILNITTIRVTWDTAFLGIAHLAVRGANECGPSEWSESLVIDVANTVGLIDPENQIIVSIFPNPGNGAFTIHLQSDMDGLVALCLFNPLGEIIFEKTDISLSGINSELMITTGAQSGIYYLQIENQSGVSMHKIIVQNN